ncbi:MAG: hypothetical protein K2X48_00275 [Chitinophagaceae bacterium]|nr:hypothetical protein [Chitinophagaceae bacterium]
MNKIESNKHLNAEKKRIKKRQKELESVIHANWIELKQNLQPKNLAGEIFSKTFSSNNNTHSGSLADTISEFAAILTKAAVLKAQEKMSDWLRKK